MPAKRTILIHYSEIALKGGNRRYFENILVKNIRQKFKTLPRTMVRKIFGRILIETEALPAKAERALLEISGIANFSFVSVVQPELAEIKKTAYRMLKDKRFKSFRLTVKRSFKGFPYDSLEIAKIVGQHLVDKLKKKVDLKSPDVNCRIEIMNDRAFVYIDKHQGLSGLPVGASGKLVCLLSGGIDSPVAAFKMINRGAEIVFVNFNSYPAIPKTEREKVEEIVNRLNRYQFSAKIYHIPFLEIQKAVVQACPEDYRIIFYRRMMFRLAEMAAEQENSLGLVTGESLGQVASQTIINIRAVDEVVIRPVLRPLIGENKETIIGLAETIGTYPISIQEGDDCCSLYVPQHPVTKADLSLVKAVEKRFKYAPLLKQAFTKAEIKKI